jgi:4-hydroxy-3-methylbut-2-enyl diphosphate reductase
MERAPHTPLDEVLQQNVPNKDIDESSSFEQGLIEFIPDEIVEGTILKEEPSPLSLKTLRVAEYYGACGGVNAAIKTTNEALKILDGRVPLHTHNPVVHNKRVNGQFEDNGLLVHNDRDENGDYDMSVIPDGEPYLVSAHGCTPRDLEMLRAKGCVIVDVTCPLVDAEHRKARTAVENGQNIILFGAIRNGVIHPEPRGVIGEVPKDSITLISSTQDAIDLQPEEGKEYVWINQTTQSTREIQENRDIIKQKIPGMKIAGGTQGCYATDHRQDAVVKLAGKVQHIMVLTSENSNNGTNLIKRSEEEGVPASLIQGADSILWDKWFAENSDIVEAGLSAAASSTPQMVDEIVSECESRGIEVIYEIPDVPEDPETTFKLRRANLEELQKYADTLVSRS